MYLSFNAYKLYLRYYDKWTVTQKTFSPVSFNPLILFEKNWSILVLSV